jgi:hypothetical protein
LVFWTTENLATLIIMTFVVTFLARRFQCSITADLITIVVIYVCRIPTCLFKYRHCVA